MYLIRDNWPYFFWFLFYLILFGALTFGIIIPLYLLFFIIAFTPLSEKLWRVVMGIRPLRLKSEKDRLLPLFKEVYDKAYYESYESISLKVDLYIQESMEINAFAFGKGTLVLTKGSIDLLSDECLQGLIAHELGHFAYRDTSVALFAAVANFPMSFLMRTFYKIEFKLESDSIGLARMAFGFFFAIFKGLDFLSGLMLMYHKRMYEYSADMFALKCGFGKNMAEVLEQIYHTSISTPKSIKEQIRATHPPLTKRIERLEDVLY